MVDSPKRKGSPGADDDDQTNKRSKTADSKPPAAPPDSQISPALALAYWSSTAPTVSGVLGGFPEVSRVDIIGSSTFLAKLRRKSKHHPPGQKLSRACDCGAGIGRITTGLLSKVAEAVDIVEPIKAMTDKLEREPGIGTIWNVGLEDWPLEDHDHVYDLVWNQWCVGQLKDAQFVAYLRRLPSVLSDGGWIIVKENLSNHGGDEDVYDETDSSVTRTEANFLKLFEEAGLKVVATELQKGMPKGLYPVRAWALQPR